MNMKKVLIAIALASAALAAHADCYSEGVRVGTVQKFSSKGVVNKSWEGELVMEGLKLKSSETGLQGGNVWKFSVLEPAVAKVIDESVMTGGQIALKYCQTFPFGSIGTTDTPYRIVQAVARK
jgi:hypothetical protein